ncbi:MAG: ABC transporter permease [Nitrososphaerales archaeon]
MKFSFHRTTMVAKGHIRGWYRNRNNIFWTLAFPIVMMVLFGGIFGFFQGARPQVFVQNDDTIGDNPSTLSVRLVNLLESSDLLDLKSIDGADRAGISHLLVIPAGFEEDVKRGSAVLTLKEAGRETVSETLSSILDTMNIEVSGTSRLITLREEALATRGSLNFVEFLMPGIIGITIMTGGVFGAINTNTKYKANHVLRKLATTPLRKSEWIGGMMIYQLFLSLIGTVIIISVAFAVFRVTLLPHVVAVLVLVSGALAFPGMGMLMARFIPDEESAEAAGNAVTFPMMFLSGTFFPLDLMPQFLQVIARIFPLTYLNEGLRAAFFFGDLETALFNAGVLIVFGVTVLVLGSIVTNWREE